MEHEEYTVENYPSFGKKYNSEKAIISLTSWKARISTVSKTLFSILLQCPGFHIVLVLSEEEFPKMMDELPDNLKLFVDNELIEVLWVYKNYKSFKKVLFTMDKYRDVPVISADDDCIYTCNYAQELYDKWTENKNAIIKYGYYSKKCYGTYGPCTLYFPGCYKILSIRNIDISFSKYNGDDDYYTDTLYQHKIRTIPVHNKIIHPFTFHDENKPLHKTPFQKGKVGFIVRNEL